MAAPILVVLPPPAGPRGDGLESVSVAGLPVARRRALAAGRAGFADILPADGDQAVLDAVPRRIVILGAHIVPQPAWLRALLAMPLVSERLYVDGDAVAVIETDEPGRVLEAAARCHGAEDLARALGRGVSVVRRPLEPSGRFVLGALADVPAAEAWLLRSLIKPSEGFMSRHIERRISLAVTRRLADTRITPNVMTVVSVGIGLLGAPFFLSQASALQTIGAVLFLAHSVLDGCDGEIARLKFLESRAGAMLDFWGDNLVHVAVFACMGVGGPSPRTAGGRSCSAASPSRAPWPPRSSRRAASSAAGRPPPHRRPGAWWRRSRTATSST